VKGDLLAWETDADGKPSKIKSGDLGIRYGTFMTLALRHFDATPLDKWLEWP